MSDAAFCDSGGKKISNVSINNNKFNSVKALNLIFAIRRRRWGSRRQSC